ncbi:conserved Plasmodium protein, unknown function [Plasmodium malariae]|uniref:Succinate dehydrogenase assembly factor 4, mitochondrial n=1 Tax=Plasmodium malariae TaxID=5858 RepID=A0A1C3L2Y5_PLAMA|nr:conserved Plasmodium protein, unknown function [Plasmodium malariae]
MKKFSHSISLSRNKLLSFNFNAYHNNRTEKKIVPQQFRKHSFIILNGFSHECFSTLEINNSVEISKDKLKDKGNNKYFKKYEKEKKSNESDKTEKQNKDKKEEKLNDIVKEEKEKQKEIDSTEKLPEEFGYKYDKHEPTMFGDWSHNCRVTDF